MTKATRRARRGEATELIESALTADTPECILWPFGLFANGYGKVKIHGRTAYVHHVACERAHGPRPDRADAAHSCRHRHCFNPRHLSWKSRAENEADKLRDGTQVRGERTPTARLTRDQVVEIRRRAARNATSAQLAADFGVSPNQVRKIVRRAAWAWLS